MTSSIFPDINVLVALSVADHQHHSAAQRWYRGAGEPELVVGRLSQISFLRLMTTKAVLGVDTLSNERAWSLYDQLSKCGIVRFAGEPAGIDQLLREFSRSDAASPKRWTDAYLSAFAVQTKLRLATFDVALARSTPRSILLSTI